MQGQIKTRDAYCITAWISRGVYIQRSSSSTSTWKARERLAGVGLKPSSELSYTFLLTILMGKNA